MTDDEIKTVFTNGLYVKYTSPLIQVRNTCIRGLIL